MVQSSKNPHAYSLLNQLWENSFAILKEFIALYRREPKSEEKYKNVALGKWLASQRLNYNEKTFPPYRKDLLDSVGVSISVAKWSVTWREQINAYEAFIKAHGTVYIEKDTVFGGHNLYWWAVRQRQKMRRCELPQQKIDQLDALGFVWDAFSSSWREDIATYASYMDEHKKEPSYSEVYGDFRIGIWHDLQKRRQRAGVLHGYKIKQLETIGITWQE